jgi:hypothetical protein
MTAKIDRIDKIEKTFPGHKVKALVSDAREKLRLSDEAFSSKGISPVPGWQKSPVDPMNFFSVFPCLRMKNGYVLRSYVMRWHDGMGSVFAMRTDAPFPEPVDCPTDYPKPIPDDAVGEIMQVVEGDGSLWSYLSASIFSREVNEFGASGHFWNWRWHSIIGSDFWKPTGDANKFDETISAIEEPLKNTDDWDWEGTVPLYWNPVVRKENKIVKVTFYTLSCHYRESITRHVDTYRYGNYEFQSAAKSIASGKGGFVV